MNDQQSMTSLKAIVNVFVYNVLARCIVCHFGGNGFSVMLLCPLDRGLVGSLWT